MHLEPTFRGIAWIGEGRFNCLSIPRRERGAGSFEPSLFEQYVDPKDVFLREGGAPEDRAGTEERERDERPKRPVLVHADRGVCSARYGSLIEDTLQAEWPGKWFLEVAKHRGRMCHAMGETHIKPNTMSLKWAIDP